MKKNNTQLYLPLKHLKNASYSVRRYFVDSFFTQLGDAGLFENKSILDIGGQKESKRGVFNIVHYNTKVKYVNISPRTNPDILCSGDNIPVENGSFDMVILAETLEHVLNPENFIKEASRILKNDGELIICTPFNYHVHGDPDDYGRYTPSWYTSILKTHGFSNIHIEYQGRFYAVFVQLMRLWLHEKGKSSAKMVRGFYRVLHACLFPIFKAIIKKDYSEKTINSPIFSGYTTGFGIVARKKV